jgi:DNA polymerase elongation subunit (family B)
MRAAMRALLYGNSTNSLDRLEEAVHDVQRVLQRFIDKNVPFNDYVMSRSLRAEYKARNPKLPHVIVTNKMRQRAPGSEPKPGNRVPFVITYTGVKNATSSERAEDPDYVLENNLVVDRTYYANLVVTGLSGLLDPLLCNTNVTIETIAKAYLHRIVAQDSGCRALATTPPIALIRLHLRQEKIQNKKQKSIKSFFTPQ